MFHCEIKRSTSRIRWVCSKERNRLPASELCCLFTQRTANSSRYMTLTDIERNNFRFDAVSSVYVATPTDLSCDLELTLINGTSPSPSKDSLTSSSAPNPSSTDCAKPTEGVTGSCEATESPAPCRLRNRISADPIDRRFCTYLQRGSDSNHASSQLSELRISATLRINRLRRDRVMSSVRSGRSSSTASSAELHNPVVKNRTPDSCPARRRSLRPPVRGQRSVRCEACRCRIPFRAAEVRSATRHR